MEMVKLGDVVDLKWGDTNTTKKSYVESGYVAYSASGPDGYLPHADYDETGIVLSAIGSHCGGTWLAEGKWSCIKNTIRILGNNDQADIRYVYWATKTPNFWPRRGSGQPFISQGDARNCEIMLPARDVQVAIAETLQSFDDKIDLNRRMNATLEAQARALFRDWFVDFGPTRAKMAGATPYLPADLWELFPDALGEDGLPEGWKESEIGREVEAVGGSTPSTKNEDYWSDEVNWATPKDLSGLEAPVLSTTSRMISEEGLEKISSGLLPVGTVLMSSRAPVGYLAINTIPLAVNQGFIAMKCDGRLTSTFTWLWCSENMSRIKGRANGSTFQEISKKNFRPLKVTVPSAELLEAFENRARPLFEMIVENVSEIEKLASTRDYLLPKLMSDEVSAL